MPGDSKKLELLLILFTRLIFTSVNMALWWWKYLSEMYLEIHMSEIQELWNLFWNTLKIAVAIEMGKAGVCFEILIKGDTQYYALTLL